jgi:hypothetical protein
VVLLHVCFVADFVFCLLRCSFRVSNLLLCFRYKEFELVLLHVFFLAANLVLFVALFLSCFQSSSFLVVFQVQGV